MAAKLASRVYSLERVQEREGVWAESRPRVTRVRVQSEGRERKRATRVRVRGAYQWLMKSSAANGPFQEP